MVSFHRPSLTWLSNPNPNPNLNQATPRAVLVAVSRVSVWPVAIAHAEVCEERRGARGAVEDGHVPRAAGSTLRK